MLTKAVLFVFLGGWQAWAGGLLPFQFEPNRGQFPEEVLYAARGRTGPLPVGPDSIQLSRSVRLDFAGQNRHSTWLPLDPARGVTNYRIGQDPGGWISGVPHFNRLHRAAIYPGVDVELYGAEGRLEYDFTLRPGANPRDIHMRFQGAAAVAIDSEGSLVVSTPDGALIQRRPYSYQRTAAGQRAVESHYRLLGRLEVGIELADYDPNATLTVDPVIESFTLLGGSADDRAFAASGGFLVGSTESADFPGVVSARHRGSDVFIYSPGDGNTLIIGGSGDDVVTSVSGNLIGGYTTSPDFPVRGYSGSPQTTYGGGASDGFFIVLSGGYPSLISYVGGSGDDRVTAVAALTSYGPYFVAGTTTSPDLPLLRPWQTSPSGAFVAGYDYNANPSLSTYLGGSDGVDLPLAVLTTSSTDFYIAGETRSTDWAPAPGWIGSRQGASDGFLIHAHAPSSLEPFAITDALLFGGAGEDKITALAARPDGTLSAAGTTSSAEMNGYHGGPSDAFAVTFPADLRTQSGLLLIGGGGADEATAMSVNKFGETAVGGWTTSRDLPLKDPLQPGYGGGPDDAFLYYADASGQPIVSTYLGGNGSDRIASVLFDDAQRIYAAGSSTSTDLALKNSPQSNAGGWDGFQVVLRSSRIRAAGLTVGRDLTGIATVQLGDPETAAGVPLTVTSADPSRVALALRPDDPGAASLTIAYRSGDDLAARSFRVYCLAESGTTRLALSAPGYEDRSMNVRCVPGVLFVTPTDVLLRTGQYSHGASFAVFPAAIDPDSGRMLAPQPPRPGAPAIRIDAATSDPAVAALTSTSLTVDNYSILDHPAPAFGFTSSINGTAGITLNASSGWTLYPSSTVHIRVTGPGVFLRLPFGAKDVTSGVLYYPTPLLESGSMDVTFTSSDPAKVRLATSNGAPGKASFTGTCAASAPCTPLYLEVLDPTGEVYITASNPDNDTVRAAVAFTQLSAGFFYADNRAVLLTESGMNTTTSQTVFARMWVGSPDSIAFPNPAPLLRSGAPPVLVSVSNSDPGNFPAAPTQLTWLQGTDFFWPVVINAKSAGTATLTLRSGQVDLHAVPLKLNVPGQQITLESATAGKDLQTPIRFNLVGLADAKPVTVTLSSGDPSRLLLSTDPAVPGQASVAVPATYGATIYVQALADAGDVEISATADRFATGKSTVHLAPSGFAWTANSFYLGSSFPGPAVSAYILDPRNLAAISPQSVRPGLDGSLHIQNSNPAAATLDVSSLPLSAFVVSPPIVPVKAASGGETLLTLTQPDGFTPPTGRGPLRVKAPRAFLQLLAPDLGRNMQSQGNVVPSGGAVAAQIVVTSADPSKLVISTSSSDLGSGSVTVARRSDGGYPTLYFQALDGPADVKVTATAGGFDPVARVVRIFPTTLVLSTSAGTVTDLQLSATTAQDAVNLNLYALSLEDRANQLTGSGYDDRVIRPGLDPIQVQVNNTNPAVAVVQNNPVSLNGLTASSPVRVKPLMGGETQLSLAMPPGFVAPPPGFGKTARIVVQGAAFVLPSVTLGKDLQTAVTLGLANDGSSVPTDVDVTIMSSHPTKLLLSETGNAPGGGSIVIHFAANAAASRTVYLQALDSGGTATVTVSAPSYGGSQATINFSDAVMIADNSTITLTPGGPVSRIRFTPRSAQYRSLFFRFRPGLPPFDIVAITSDASVFTLPSPKVNVSGGDSEVFVDVQPAGSGTAQLLLQWPNLPAVVGVNVRVQGGTFNISGPGPIGKDLQGVVTLSPQNQPMTVTLTSSDPSRLLLSLSATAPGQASVVLNVPAGQQARLYAQSLASNGSVDITASAPGFDKATLSIPLTEATLYMRAKSQVSTLTTLSAPLAFDVTLRPRSSYSDQPQGLRPGIPPVTITIGTTDPAVGSLTPSQLVFSAGDFTKTLSFQPLAPGSTLLSASVPPGFADSLSQRQALLTILAPQIIFNGSLSVGKDLVKGIGASLVGGTAHPVTLTVTSSDPSRLLLFTATSPTPAASVALGFPPTYPGGFTLVGLASSGTVRLNVAGPGFPPVSYDVTLEPSGFRIIGAPASAPAGSSGIMNVIPCALTPGSLVPDGDSTLRPGVAGIAVSLTSSDPAVAGGSTTTFLPGDAGHSLTFTSKGPGVVTFTLSLPDGYFLPSFGGTATITFR